MSNRAELEMKITFLEQAFEQLSDEFYQQQKIISQLQIQQTALIDKMHALKGAGSDNEPVSHIDERPPHY